MIFRALIFTGEDGRERSLSQQRKRQSKEGSLIFPYLLHPPVHSGPINDRKLVTALTRPNTTLALQAIGDNVRSLHEFK